MIVSFNPGDLLKSCLESLEPERESVPFEVIVVDNASRDGTMALLAAEFPWVQAIPAGSNLGFARANNVAMRRARGDYLLFLNPDTVVPRGTLEGALETLKGLPKVGMLGCKLVRPDGSFDHASKLGFPTPLAALFYFSGLSRLRPDSPRFARYTAGELGADEVGLVDAICGAFMLVRRTAIEEVGPFDERFWLYAEDLDLCYRFWQSGWEVLYWPRAEVIHVKGGKNIRRDSWRANYAFHRGMWLFYEKHYARKRSRVVSAAVWGGIWVKLALSGAQALVGRSVSKKRSLGTPR